MTAAASCDRSTVAQEPNASELRRRLRAVVIVLVPQDWGIFRVTLFRVIDKAPPAALYAMRDRIKEFVL